MSRKKLTKKQMREDQFRDILEEFYFGVIEGLEKHWATYLAGFLVLLIAGFGALYFWNSHQRHVAQSSYLLTQVMEAYSAPVGKDTKDNNSAQLTFGTNQARLKAVDTRLKALEKQAGSDESGNIAVFYKALTQADSGKIKDAITTVGPLTEDARLAPVALGLRARLYEASGEFKKAEADWKALASLKNADFPEGEGLWQLGQFYERQGEDAKAVDAYKKIEEAFSGKEDKDAQGGLAERARSRLEAIKGAA